MTLAILAYLGGVLTILSPCILPVLPFVFSGARGSFRTTGLPLLAGMAVTFAVFSTLAVAGGAWVVQANEWGRWVALALLSLFALTLLSPRFAEFITRPFTRAGSAIQHRQFEERGPGASFILGMACGLLWAPCAGPILGLILTGAALNGAKASTAVLLLAYALGAATSLALALVAGGKLLGVMKRYLGADEWVRRLLGVAVLVGVLAIVLGWDRGILTRVSQVRTESVEQTLLQRFHPDAAVPTQTVADVPESLGVEGQLPELNGIEQWINSSPLTRESLRGKVVLIDFWTYSCINCLRTLPYVRAWHEKYKDAGLVIIGVHTPEFAFEKKVTNVQKAVRELGISYPVAIDNQYAVWNAFQNRYWPAHYFVDGQGRIRHHHFGEGKYDQSERVIQQLLKERNPNTAVPSGVIEARGQGATASPGGDIESPETYIGSRRAQNRVEPADPLALNQWSLTGAWAVNDERGRLEKAPGKITFRFHARDLHLVLGPGGKTAQQFIVRLDGQAPGAQHGTDINAKGEGVVREHRLYQLIRQSEGAVKDRTFEIEFIDPGVDAFAFTFG